METLFDTTETVTLPAFAADTLGESVTLTVPSDVASLVRDLAPALVYGPSFRRAVADGLRDASCAADSYPDIARTRIVRLWERYAA